MGIQMPFLFWFLCSVSLCWCSIFFQWLAISVDPISRSWLFSRNAEVKKITENVFKQWLFPVLTDDGNLALLWITEKRTDIWTSDSFKKGNQECIQMHTGMYIFAYNVIFKNNSSYSFLSYLPPLPMGVPSVPVCRLQASQQICLCPWKSLKDSPDPAEIEMSCLNSVGLLWNLVGRDAEGRIHRVPVTAAGTGEWGFPEWDVLSSH